MSEDKLKELEKAFDGNLELVLFYVSWQKHNRNATEAYLEINPKVDRLSAQVQGSRLLSRIDRVAVMKCYGLGQEEYFQQLKDGLEATKWNDFTGEREPDHKTRKDYHDKLGKMLGIETSGGITIDNKILVIPAELIGKYGIASDAKDSSTG